MSGKYKKLAKKVADLHFKDKFEGRSKTAGEIRFVKDQGPEGRDVPKEYKFNPKSLKPLSKTLWSLSCSLGHLVSAHERFTKIKALSVSPDGKLGGQGYIQSVRDMRSKMTEAIETLSSLVDTIDDELQAPHWDPDEVGVSEDDAEEVEEMIEDSDKIQQNPQEYVEEEYQEEVVTDVGEEGE